MSEPDLAELLLRAVKDLWSIEGQIVCLESFLANPPTKEMSMAMLRDLRLKRAELERAVDSCAGVDVAAKRLEPI